MKKEYLQQLAIKFVVIIFLLQALYCVLHDYRMTLYNTLVVPAIGSFFATVFWEGVEHMVSKLKKDPQN